MAFVLRTIRRRDRFCLPFVCSFSLVVVVAFVGIVATVLSSRAVVSDGCAEPMYGLCRSVRRIPVDVLGMPIVAKLKSRQRLCWADVCVAFLFVRYRGKREAVTRVLSVCALAAVLVE